VVKLPGKRFTTEAQSFHRDTQRMGYAESHKSKIELLLMHARVAVNID